MNFTFILSQIIGAAGYATLSVSYFKKNKKDILLIQIISYIFFTLHYYLLGGKTGAICNLLGLIAFIIIYIFDKKNTKNKKILTICIIPFLVIIALITYQDVFSIFPIIASIFAILSFISDDENKIRGIGIIAAICWLIYAIVYKSYVAIAFEIIALSATVIAFFKNINKRNKTL